MSFRYCVLCVFDLRNVQHWKQSKSKEFSTQISILGADSEWYTGVFGSVELKWQGQLWRAMKNPHCAGKLVYNNRSSHFRTFFQATFLFENSKCRFLFLKGGVWREKVCIIENLLFQALIQCLKKLFKEMPICCTFTTSTYCQRCRNMPPVMQLRQCGANHTIFILQISYNVYDTRWKKFFLKNKK